MEKNEKNYKFYLGIDISKETFDATFLNSIEKKYVHMQFVNDETGFDKLNKWLKKDKNFSYSETLICMEHTGVYTRMIQVYLTKIKANIWLESSLQIKKSLGLTRGKNDKIDSKRIAEYAYRYQDKAVLKTYQSKSLDRLKDLITARIRLNKSLQIIKVSIKELKRVDKEQGAEVELLNLSAIRGIEQSIKQIEESMEEIINSNNDLKEVFELASSVKGVGKILTIKLMVYTNCFTKFETTRQLCCYCGAAPFDYSSGTSVRGKTGVSKFANMDLKSTLHLSAISSIQHNAELKKYYERKVAEGKNKMSVINAVRNKILARVVAVVRRKTPYVNLAVAA